jgi:hypothetical protein
LISRPCGRESETLGADAGGDKLPDQDGVSSGTLPSSRTLWAQLELPEQHGSARPLAPTAVGSPVSPVIEAENEEDEDDGDDSDSGDNIAANRHGVGLTDATVDDGADKESTEVSSRRALVWGGIWDTSNPSSAGGHAGHSAATAQPSASAVPPRMRVGAGSTIVESTDTLALPRIHGAEDPMHANLPYSEEGPSTAAGRTRLGLNAPPVYRAPLHRSTDALTLRAHAQLPASRVTAVPNIEEDVTDAPTQPAGGGVAVTADLWASVLGPNLHASSLRTAQPEPLAVQFQQHQQQHVQSAGGKGAIGSHLSAADLRNLTAALSGSAAATNELLYGRSLSGSDSGDVPPGRRSSQDAHVSSHRVPARK